MEVRRSSCELGFRGKSVSQKMDKTVEVNMACMGSIMACPARAPLKIVLGGEWLLGVYPVHFS